MDKMPVLDGNHCIVLLYFFGYKMASFPFQNSHRNLDPSYKMDLDVSRSIL